jgi:hypothetical protein
MPPPSTVIREVYEFNDYVPPEIVRQDIEATRAKALEIAVLHGIERPHISELYDGVFDEYGPPMYALGPTSRLKRPETPQEALYYAYACGVSCARYIIIIRNQDYLDYLDQHA